MKKQVKIIVPNKLEEITLEMYQKYLAYREKNPNPPLQEYKTLVVAVCCNLGYTTVRETMSIADIDNISLVVIPLIKELDEFTFEDKLLFDPFVKFDKVKFGFITNFEEMTGGEYADLSTHISKWDSMHKAMAVLYRPITKTKRNIMLKVVQYETEEYNGTAKYADGMLRMPAYKVLYTLSFIESSYQSCQSIFLTYTQNLLKKIPSRKLGRDMDLKKLSKIIGDGTNHSMQ